MMRLGSMSYYQYVCLFVELFAVTHKSLICDVNRLVCVLVGIYNITVKYLFHTSFLALASI